MRCGSSFFFPPFFFFFPHNITATKPRPPLFFFFSCVPLGLSRTSAFQIFSRTSLFSFLWGGTCRAFTLSLTTTSLTFGLCANPFFFPFSPLRKNCYYRRPFFPLRLSELTFFRPGSLFLFFPFSCINEGHQIPPFPSSLFQ